MNSLSILHVSDIHIRKQGDWLNKLCMHIQVKQPDITVLTGDIVTRGWEEKAVEQFFRVMPFLVESLVPLPLWSIGNTGAVPNRTHGDLLENMISSCSSKNL